MRYHYYTDNKSIVVVTSTYAGKIVRGVAKRHGDDEFNYEYGKALAKARCDAKVAERRVKRAEDKYEEAVSQYNDAVTQRVKMKDYYIDSLNELSYYTRAIDYIEQVGPEQFQGISEEVSSNGFIMK